MGNKRAGKPVSNSKKSEKLPKITKSTNGTKMTMCTVPLVAPRSPIRERRTDRRIAAGKRPVMTRSFPGKIRAANRRSVDPCDNSNDSGLGFDNHTDHHASLAERLTWPHERTEAKRRRVDIKLEDDEVNDNFSFPETTLRTSKNNIPMIRSTPSSVSSVLNINNTQTTSNVQNIPRCTPNRSSSNHPITLASQLAATSRTADVSLRILNQPEQQHRARYQTEGSRGAVKDRSGNGFPVVRLHGYNKPATLQVFIGTDVGKVTPHMFYQACRVSGKNSTPCIEKKVDGTVLIELQLDPSKDMVGTCDCVGILKERNVDVEHRFPDQVGSRSKKKSTRCRMIFRTSITHDNGVQETLQICSQPIVCTQPPGIPEICKKSLSSCSAVGGMELFILGKNFLKDTKVYFQQVDEEGLQWEQYVVPDKEFLQQTHLVCVVPPYARSDITEPVTVRLLVVSSGKTSESHQFVYTPTNGPVASVHSESAPTFMNKSHWSSLNKHEQGIMPPPDTNQMPLSQRRSSINMSSESHSPPLHGLKQELIDENSQNSVIDPLELHRERYRNLSESSLDAHQGDSNMTMINENSMDLLHHNSVSIDLMNQNINESSITCISDGGMEILHHSSANQAKNAVNSRIQLNGSTVMLPPNHTHTNIPHSIMRDELNVMDLRMKMPAATVADLALTHAPSLATLQSFGVTEPTNTPLPAQTAQSIENYLSTIETKTVDALSLPATTALQLSHILSSTAHNTVVNNQILPVQNLLTTVTTPSLSHFGSVTSHLGANSNVTNYNITQPSVLVVPTVEVSSEQTLMLRAASISPIQSMNNNILTKPLIVDKHINLNSTIDVNVHSPQDMLMSNKSPLISTATAQDMLMHSSQPNLVVSSTPSLESTDVVNTNVQTPSNLSSDIILNSQISPSMMCRSTTGLPQDGLLSMCSSNVPTDANLMQSHSSPLAPLLTDANSPPLAPAHSPVALTNQLNSVISTSEPEKAILLKAAVDLLVTQKKLSELETLTSSANMMNDILSSSRTSPSDSTSTNKSLVDNVAIGQLNSEKKNEDRMIPTGFATMSDHELINIINPSCFDQV